MPLVVHLENYQDLSKELTKSVVKVFIDNSLGEEKRIEVQRRNEKGV